MKRWLERYGGAVALALVVLAIISGGIVFLVGASAGQPVEVATPTATSLQKSTPSFSQAKLNINIASAQELEALPGIGPVLAGRVVQYREEHGPFQRIEDIVDVPGIGPAIFQKIKGLITVSPVGPAESIPTPTPSLSTPTPTATSVPGVTPTPPPTLAQPTSTPTLQPPTPTSTSAALKVNINTASAQELEALPGIGPVLAGRVVQYREEHGPFQRIEDIVDVPGIGPALFQEIKALITVGPYTATSTPTTPTPTPSPLPSVPLDPTATPTPLPVATIPTLTPTPLSPTSSGCHPSYPDVCIPPPPPDLDCKDISFRNFRVLPPDPQGFDGDNDGIGCET